MPPTVAEVLAAAGPSAAPKEDAHLVDAFANSDDEAAAPMELEPSPAQVSALIAEKRWHKFELHCVDDLRRRALAPLARDASDLVRALKGARVHGPWCNVPVRLLLAIKYTCANRAEKLKMLNAPAEQRGWRERGGDMLIECKNKMVIAVQCKDIANLANAGISLAHFQTLAARCKRYNKTIQKPNTTPSGLLQLHKETKVSNMSIGDLKEVHDIDTMAICNFHSDQPRAPPRYGLDDTEHTTEVVDLPGIYVVDADKNAAAARELAKELADAHADEAKNDVDTAEYDEDDAEAHAQEQRERVALFEAARPQNAKPRAFQTITANKIKKTPGCHLVRAPTGCGKTAIIALAMGLLFKKPRANRRNAGAVDNWQPPVMLMIAPFIDHARQLYLRIVETLKVTFPDDWKERAVFVASEMLEKPYSSRSVQTIQELKEMLKTGVRVFVATNKSSALLLPVMKRARKMNLVVHVVSDEAHFESSDSSSAMQLLKMVDPEREERGIAASATPDARVMAIPGLHRSLELDYDDAIKKGFCADYSIVLPLVHSLGTDTEQELPMDVQTLINEHSKDALGAAALFTVNGMLLDGSRRCVAYAGDSRGSAQAAATALEAACRALGVGCWAQLVLDEHSSSARIKARKIFGNGIDYENKPILNDDGDIVDGSRPFFHFLVGVRILDQAIDLPQCDCVAIMTPPAALSDQKSVHRAMQRGGRSLRVKEDGRPSFWYIFADRVNSQWLMAFLDCLSEYDSGAKTRVSVRANDPTEQHNDGNNDELEHAAVEAVNERYRMHHNKLKTASLTLQQRVDALIANCADVPPARSDSVEIVADDCVMTFAVGTFVWRILPNWATKKRKREEDDDENGLVYGHAIELTPEQKEQCEKGLKWLKDRVDAYNSGKHELRLLITNIPAAQKVEWLITHDPELKKATSARVDVEWRGQTVPFRIGEFWRSISPNFEPVPIEKNTKKGWKRSAHVLVLTDELKQLCLDKIPGIPRRIHELESKRAAPSLTQTLEWLIEIDPELKLPMRSITPMPWNGGTYPFQGGKLWNNIYQNFTADGVGAKNKVNTPLDAEQKAMCLQGLTGIPRRLEELEKRRVAFKKNPNSGNKKSTEKLTLINIKRLIKYDPDLRYDTRTTITVLDDDGPKKPWKPGKCWDDIKLNFIEGIRSDKIHTSLSPEHMAMCYEGLPGIPRRVREYLSNPRSAVNKK